MTSSPFTILTQARYHCSLAECTYIAESNIWCNIASLPTGVNLIKSAGHFAMYLFFFPFYCALAVVPSWCRTLPLHQKASVTDESRMCSNAGRLTMLWMWHQCCMLVASGAKDSLKCDLKRQAVTCTVSRNSTQIRFAVDVV